MPPTGPRAQSSSARTILSVSSLPECGRANRRDGYEAIEEATGVEVYFATPYHSWERGTNENTNGLIRQYPPKRKSMAKVTQRECDWIQDQLNARPRKRLGFRTPEECYGTVTTVALQR